MAEMYKAMELGDQENMLGAQRSAGPLGYLRRLAGYLTRGSLSLVLLLASVGLFLFLVTILVQVSRVQQSLQREAGGRRRSLSAVAVSQEQIRADLATLRQQLAWMNASLVSLCRPCPWHWELFQGSCYLFSRSQRTWESSVSACEDMSAQLVVVNTADEQKFLQSWEIRNEKRTWIGLSDRHTEGSWQWVDGTPVGLSFWKQGEPNNHGDEDCVELYNDGWNDSLCHLEKAWICEMPSSPCPVP